MEVEAFEKLSRDLQTLWLAEYGSGLCQVLREHMDSCQDTESRTWLPYEMLTTYETFYHLYHVRQK